jgi:hypothetical protein
MDRAAREVVLVGEAAMSSSARCANSTCGSKAKEERELLQKARKEHAAFIEKTASYRALLERTDPDFFGGEIERLGGMGRRVDSARADRGE